MADKCDRCLKCFSKSANLNRHIKKAHPDEVQTLLKYKRKEQDYAFTCHYCECHFTQKHHFTAHLKKHDPNEKDNGSKVPIFYTLVISFCIFFFINFISEVSPLRLSKFISKNID